MSLQLIITNTSTKTPAISPVQHKTCDPWNPSTPRLPHFSSTHVVHRGRGRRSFSLKAAIRLVKGSSGSRGIEWWREEEVEGVDGGEVDGEIDETSAAVATCSSSRRRLGIRSPVDWRMACRVCHPSVERSWKESARSCWLATLQSSASSSWVC